MNTQQTGAMGEDAACLYLQKQGCRIVARNWRKPCGEIDIIAFDGRTLVFAEVKTRQTNSYGTPLEAITKTKFENIKRGVLNYITENNIKKYRIDVIGITIKPELKIEHLKNVSL